MRDNKKIMWMEEILHQLISDLPHSVQVFYHPKWCNKFLPPTVGFYCGYSVIPIYPEMMLGLTSIFVAPGIKKIPSHLSIKKHPHGFHGSKDVSGKSPW